MRLSTTFVYSDFKPRTSANHVRRCAPDQNSSKVHLAVTICTETWCRTRGSIPTTSSLHPDKRRHRTLAITKQRCRGRASPDVHFQWCRKQEMSGSRITSIASRITDGFLLGWPNFHMHFWRKRRNWSISVWRTRLYAASHSTSPPPDTKMVHITL